jgi:hypothetical protein
MRSRADLELTCFEADRNVVARQLKTVGIVIQESATELKMIGVENVFDPRLSKVLTAEGRALQRIARALEHLRQEVARARFPKTRKLCR